ncbi:protein strawberry notch homolog 1-like isoform X2 [Amphiura filiformis]|uniref:protein strawberry notch homolog 1-like isoform X2 n=1 Tax=Amphiura filiformis TaxID=82378 RepID=UPI003B20DB77
MKVHSRPGTPPIVVTKSVTKPTVHMMPTTTTKPPNLSRIHTAPGSLSSLVMDGTGGTGDGMNGARKNVVPVMTNDVLKRRTQSPVLRVPHAAGAEGEDEEEEEEEDMGYAETYANYMPTKLRIGIQHPDPVVETSSMSSVEPPSVWYTLSIPESTIDYGHLSALQLEAITYACQQHESYLEGGIRAGFLIGDGAGVGKGRTVAGVIYENYLLGRKRALWLSVSNDLKYDAMRDLKDIGASNIPVHSLTKFKYAKINSKENGYCKKGVIFSTYSGLIGETHSNHKYKSRLKQLLHWCGKDYDGVIVLDECHKAKNLCPAGSSKPTKTGLTVLELQRQLPKARVVYCSATGASEPRNMAYMSRLGIWGKGTPFADFNAFIHAIEKRGVGAMEIVAMDMKLRGMYMARQLSFQGVSFKVNEIPLSKDFIKMYDEAVKLWHEARERFQKAAELMQAEHRMRKSMWGQFWSSHQRFFKYLCIAAKVKFAVKLAREAVKIGKCVVIGLQSTGEARTLDALEEAGGELNDFVSTAKGVFSALVEKHFPAPNRQKTADMFGLDLDHSGASSPANSESGRGVKRKRGRNKWDIMGKGKNWWDSDDEEDNKDKDVKQVKNNEKASDEDSDFSFSTDGEEDEGGASSNDDFNPFKNSDSGDDDPWSRSGRKPKVKKTKTTSNSTKKLQQTPSSSSTPKNSNMSSALLAAGIGQSKTDPKRDIIRKSDSFANIPSATSSLLLPGMDAYERVQLMKQELLDMLEELGPRLPPNTLDELIEELGGTDEVAEMTGRKGRVVSKDDGYVQYESRSEYDIPLEILNLTEKKRFMDGDKYIAIISEAASSGISLQADKRVPNKRRRVHITLELPWSADRAIQQFGRTHRSNQVTAPEYVFLISELAGEQRFASIVAKRLESLGALTHGDRRATESRDLSRFNIDNKYGRAALETVMKSILELETPVVPPPKSYQGPFFEDVKQALVGVGLIQMEERYQLPVLDKDYNNLSKFLNRILGMSVELQNGLFKYFSDTLQHIVGLAKRDGQWDMGILDISSGEGPKVKKLEVVTFSGSFNTSNSTTQLFKVSAERGLSWHNAVRLWSDLVTNEEGFYISQLSKNKKKTAILVKAGTTQNALKKQLMHIYRPNTGQQLRMETLPNIRRKYRKVNIPDEAQGHWQMQYMAAETQCTHAYWKERCRKVSLGLSCEVGLRRRTYYVLGGSVLSVWSRVEAILNAQPGSLSKMQIIRLRIDDGSKIVGLLIPRNCIATLRKGLAEGATTYTDTFT